MTEAAKNDARIAERVEFYAKRVPEELYRISTDPDCLNNLIAEPTEQSQIETLRLKLREHLETSKDPQVEGFVSLVK